MAKKVVRLQLADPTDESGLERGFRLLHIFPPEVRSISYRPAYSLALSLSLNASHCINMFRFNFAYTTFSPRTSSFIHSKWETYSYRFTDRLGLASLPWCWSSFDDSICGLSIEGTIDDASRLGVCPQVDWEESSGPGAVGYLIATHVSATWHIIDIGGVGDDLCKVFSTTYSWIVM